MQKGNPQLENGYTRIANELLEAVYKHKFTGLEIDAILVLWRFSYGYNRKYAPLSYQNLADEMGISRSRAYATIKKLRDYRVVNKKVDGLCISKGYRQWDVPLREDKVSTHQRTLCLPVGVHIHNKENFKDNFKDNDGRFVNKKFKNVAGMFRISDLLAKTCLSELKS